MSPFDHVLVILRKGFSKEDDQCTFLIVLYIWPVWLLTALLIFSESYPAYTVLPLIITYSDVKFTGAGAQKYIFGEIIFTHLPSDIAVFSPANGVQVVALVELIPKGQ